jgi:RimJ/RimL family protein N-acetyltransferase
VFRVLGTPGPLGSIPPFRSFVSRRFGKSEATTHGPSMPSVHRARAGSKLALAVTSSPINPTSRVEVRLPAEDDRERLVQLWRDEGFMIFAGGVLDADAANRRFDKMLLRAEELPFAKQPAIELATGVIIGYAGADWFEFEGQNRLEFGYRLVPEARGRGYATEAGQAVLAKVTDSFRGEILANIDPRNHASQNVARKLGFEFWKLAAVKGYLDNIYRLQIACPPLSGPPSRRPR